MESLSEKNDDLRKYLLDQLDAEAAEEFDEKLLTEPDFFELISLVEQELLDDFVAGKLPPEEHGRVEFFYNSAGPNKKKLDFAQTIFDIAGKKTAESETASALIISSAENDSEPSAINAGEEKNAKTNALPVNSIFNLFRQQRWIIAAATAIIFTVALFFIWNSRSDSLSSREIELAKLNQTPALDVGGRFGNRLVELPIETEPSREIGTQTPKIELSEGGDQIVRFRLPLITRQSENYRATFFEKNGNEIFYEIFTVFELKPQTESGELFLQILVPAKYFRAGDHKINIQGLGENKTPIQSGDYLFRIIKK